MTVELQRYSELAHREEFERLRRTREEIADPARGARFDRLLEFVRPGRPARGSRVRFDWPARETLRERIAVLPDLTAPAFRQFRHGRKIDAFTLDVSGGMATRGGLIWIDDRVTVSEFQRVGAFTRHGAMWSITEELQAWAYDPLSQTAEIDLSDAEALDERFVYLALDGRVSGHNFGHFIHDLLYQLPAIDKMIEEFGDRLKLVLLGLNKSAPMFRYPIQKLILEKLGIADRFVDVRGRNVVFTRGYAASSPMANNGVMHAYSAHYCKHRVRKAFGIQDRLATGPMYSIERSEYGVVTRTFENQDELNAVMRRHRVEPIVVGDLSATEIVELFSRAGGIVGAHGAGLMNILFADVSAPIVELCNTPDVWDTIANAAIAWRHSYARIPMEPGGRNRIDIEALKAEMTRLTGLD